MINSRVIVYAAIYYLDYKKSIKFHMNKSLYIRYIHVRLHELAFLRNLRIQLLLNSIKQN